MSRSGLRRRKAFALSLVALAGCADGGDARGEASAGGESAATDVGPTAPPPVAGDVQTSDGVTAVIARCTESADDDCDAIDDDCDGTIDEGCGLSNGVVQVTAAWGNDADIDLYVQEPRGDTLSFQRGRSTAGGRVDRVGRGGCVESGAPTRLESLVWEGDAVLRGTYEVALHYWGECQSLAGPTEVTVSVSVAGRVIQTMSYVLSPNELKEIATFDVQ